MKTTFTFDNDGTNILQALYLSWLNDFLTVERFAEHYNLSVEEAKTLIELGRANHERVVEALAS